MSGHIQSSVDLRRLKQRPITPQYSSAESFIYFVSLDHSRRVSELTGEIMHSGSKCVGVHWLPVCPGKSEILKECKLLLLSLRSLSRQQQRFDRARQRLHSHWTQPAISGWLPLSLTCQGTLKSLFSHSLCRDPGSNPLILAFYCPFKASYGHS